MGVDVDLHVTPAHSKITMVALLFTEHAGSIQPGECRCEIRESQSPVKVMVIHHLSVRQLSQ